MPDWNDVRRLALGLPETDERVSRGDLQWRVREKLFVWERPLRRSDLATLSEGAPSGAILGARVEDLGEKEVLLSTGSPALFTIPHFDGYPAVLVLLERIEMAELEDVVIGAWLARAPARLAKEVSGSARERHQ